MPPTVPYASLPVSQSEIAYAYGPDSQRRPNVVAGRIEELRIDDSVRYPGTQRSIWVHAPAGHRPSEAAGVMFFNDGWWNLDPDGAVRAGIVLDNLAAEAELPPLIGVFVDPGIRSVEEGDVRRNRNLEYDAFDDRYSSFLLEEVLPLIGSRYRISAEPSMHGICGGSSGGNAAFTAAWTRPDGFGRVIAFNSSFAQMPGGNPYPRLLVTEEMRSLRIFLQAARHDVDWGVPGTNWFAESLRTAAALAEAGYDFRLIVGEGGHSPNHGGVLLPDALRWLWQDGEAA